MSTALIVVLAVAGVLVLIVIGVFNRLVSLKQRCSEAWSQIDVQLKKRADMIPNLVETVKGYAVHEKTVLENVTKARSMMNDAAASGDPAQMAGASNMLTGALKSLFAVVENYPQLKADQNFLMLQGEISATEDRIGYARQFYNESTRFYNEYQMQFPAVMFAAMFGHKQQPFFEIEDVADRKKPEVKF